MIAIKKTSWHYRVNKFVHSLLTMNWNFVDYYCPARSICTYFWSTIFSLVVLIEIPFILFGMYSWTEVWFEYANYSEMFFEWAIQTPITLIFVPFGIVGLVIGLAVWVMGAILLLLILMFLGYYIFSLLVYKRTYNTDRSAYNADKPAQPSLLKEWWKAKKEKVCPLVNFVD